ncbi:MAG: hypothetical protein AB7G08_32420 [Hyphomicrobiaceae bacterium]
MHQILEPGQVLSQQFPANEEQSGKRLVLRRCGHVSFSRQPRQERLHLGGLVAGSGKSWESGTCDIRAAYRECWLFIQ